MTPPTDWGIWEKIGAAATALVATSLTLQKLWKSSVETGAGTDVVTLLRDELARLSSQNVLLADELNKLQQEIVRLHSQLLILTSENMRLHTEVQALTNEVGRLQTILRQHSGDTRLSLEE